MSTAERVAPTGLTSAESGAWRGLLRAHAGLVKALDAELERAHGLGLSSFEVLLRLDGAPERRMRMCDLAESVLLSRSGLTRLVDRLERDGFVAATAASRTPADRSPCSASPVRSSSAPRAPRTSRACAGTSSAASRRRSSTACAASWRAWGTVRRPRAAATTRSERPTDSRQAGERQSGGGAGAAARRFLSRHQT